MAVTTSYSFSLVESIDPFSLTGNADAASLSGGGVAVSGDHAGHTDATIFDANGDIAGSAAVLPGTVSAISQISNGNIVILADTGTDMSFTIVNGAGGIVSGPTSIEENGTDVLDPEVAGLTGGGFVVAIQDFFGGTDNDVDIRVYDNNGTLLTNFAVDATTANDQNPSVAGLADGGFAVAWHRNVGSNNEMWYAVYNANGTVRKAPALLDNFGTVNRNASVVALDNGGFAIAYEDNGWTPGDIDITLARFTAAGAFVDWDDITQNAANDTAPSATVLSNGMIAVGYTNDVFGDTDTRITLVDQNTGAALGTTTVGGSLNNELAMSIAGMNNGQVAGFSTVVELGDVVGQVRQATRFSTGDAANDTITGDELRDVVSGGAGADDIRGGLNVDNLNGDAGNDTFRFGAGEAAAGEAVNGGADSDRILALADLDLREMSVLSIEELEFNFPNAAPTTIDILAGQIGGAGLAANLLVDGNLNSQADTLRITMGAATTVNLSAFTFQTWISGGSENDRIVVLGDGDADRITGSTERDEIFGLGGNDTLVGGLGFDVVTGGDGNDFISGQDGDDSLSGNTGNDQMFGGNGLDTMNGGEGADAIRGNAGNDVINGSLGTDTIFGGGDRDTISGGDNADTIFGQAGDDNLGTGLTGNGGNDLVNGGGGNDLINGHDGQDDLLGGAGNDSLFGGNGNDFMHGGSGADTLSGQGHDDNMFGFIGIDTLHGGDGDDRLNGGDGDDTLRGGNGDDVLTGADDDDDLHGDAGNDRFNFDDGWGDDTIHDFADNGIEKINLSAVAGIDSRSDLTITNVAGGALVAFGADTITVLGVTAAQLNTTDFIF